MNSVANPAILSSGEVSDFVADIVGAVEKVTGGPAPLHTPEIAGNEWLYVKECLDTEWVSTAGSYVSRLERDLERITGSKHAIATINGTTALHTCLIAIGVGHDDEVIAPAITFAGTANAIVHAGAHPHFIDIEWRTLGLDPIKLDRRLAECAERRNNLCINRETGRVIRGVVAVHTFGHPCEIQAIVEVASRWGLPVIEDAAESLGSTYRDKHTGTFGLAGILSFNGNKIVTAGGGGAVLTDNDTLAARIRHLTTTAKQLHRWEFIHDEAGFNYRLPNLNAALACAQLERLDDFVVRKRILAKRYLEIFGSLKGVRFFGEPANCRSNFWLNVIILDSEHALERDSLLAALHDRKIEARPAWRPLHQLTPFSKMPRGDLACAEDVYRRLINLPSSPRLAGDFALRDGNQTGAIIA